MPDTKPWKSVLEILKDGAQWEARYPELDYGVAPNAPIMSVIAKHLRSKEYLKGDSRGIHLTAIVKALAR